MNWYKYLYGCLLAFYVKWGSKRYSVNVFAFHSFFLFSALELASIAMIFRPSNIKNENWSLFLFTTTGIITLFNYLYLYRSFEIIHQIVQTKKTYFGTAVMVCWFISVLTLLKLMSLK